MLHVSMRGEPEVDFEIDFDNSLESSDFGTNPSVDENPHTPNMAQQDTVAYYLEGDWGYSLDGYGTDRAPVHAHMITSVLAADAPASDGPMFFDEADDAFAAPSYLEQSPSSASYPLSLDNGHEVEMWALNPGEDSDWETMGFSDDDDAPMFVEDFHSDVGLLSFPNSRPICAAGLVKETVCERSPPPPTRAPTPARAPTPTPTRAPTPTPTRAPTPTPTPTRAPTPAPALPPHAVVSERLQILSERLQLRRAMLMSLNECRENAVDQGSAVSSMANEPGTSARHAAEAERFTNVTDVRRQVRSKGRAIERKTSNATLPPAVVDRPARRTKGNVSTTAIAPSMGPVRPQGTQPKRRTPYARLPPRTDNRIRAKKIPYPIKCALMVRVPDEDSTSMTLKYRCPLSVDLPCSSLCFSEKRPNRGDLIMSHLKSDHSIIGLYLQEEIVEKRVTFDRERGIWPKSHTFQELLQQQKDADRAQQAAMEQRAVQAKKAKEAKGNSEKKGKHM